ncbi:WSC-domain-containing protein [Viridothelium virens]|uniref:WSC-domain-containing protein n=1 Tax=Viridothelium virens TaxID=1048519 RepID=A0A6A6HJC3_VIRVR|nr:WSC-domain-containing protein [Viridothelium virens]
MYSKPGQTTTAAAPSDTGSYDYVTDSQVVPQAGNYAYIGCFLDQGYPNLLLDGPSFQNYTNTVELCADFCSGYTYFAVEDANQCLCGNTINSGSYSVPCQAECYMCCPGNLAEACGGWYRGGLYELNAPPYTPPTQTATCTYNGPATAVQTVNAAGSTSSYTYYGPITTATTYSFVVTTDSAGHTTSYTSTIPECVDGDCNTNPHTPGGTITATHTPTPTVPATAENCTFQGCYDDNGGGRTLQYRQNQLSTANMTIEECGIACRGGGYTYFGVEYGQECYCDYSIQPPHALVQPGNSQGLTCSDRTYACSGNPFEQCGGFGTIDIYYCPVSSSSSSVSITATSSSSTPSSSTSSTSSAASATGSSITCPDANCTTYTDSSDTAYVVLCSKDSDGSGMGLVTSQANFAACVSNCTGSPGCVAVSYTPANQPGGTCYQKSDQGTINSNSNVNFAILSSKFGGSCSPSLSSSSSSSSLSSTSTWSSTVSSSIWSSSSTLTSSTSISSSTSTTSSTSTSSSSSNPSSTSTTSSTSTLSSSPISSSTSTLSSSSTSSTTLTISSTSISSSTSTTSSTSTSSSTSTPSSTLTTSSASMASSTSTSSSTSTISSSTSTTGSTYTSSTTSSLSSAVSPSTWTWSGASTSSDTSTWSDTVSWSTWSSSSTPTSSSASTLSSVLASSTTTHIILEQHIVLKQLISLEYLDPKQHLHFRQCLCAERYFNVEQQYNFVLEQFRCEYYLNFG